MKINLSHFATKAYWHQFITYDFWFSIDRLRIRYLDWTISWLGLALVIAAIIIWFIKRKYTKTNPHYKNLLDRYYNLLLTIGLLLGFWFGLRWQNVAFFSSHLVAGIIVLIGLVWLFFILRFRFKKFGGQVSAWEKEQQKLKYLRMQSK